MSGYESLSADQQQAFASYFEHRKRSTGLMILLAILFPIQLFLLGKFWLGVLFWITGGGFGVWYVIEWFLTPGRVRDYNSAVAADGLKLIGSGETPTVTSVEEEE